MKTLYFNFNNEVTRFPVQQNEETGRITVAGDGGQEASFENMQQFAEMYAQARDVKPEHLKNWMLVYDGDVVSYILRAGTAGVSMSDIREPLVAVLDEMEADGMFHPLDVQRARMALLRASGDSDASEVLASCAETEIARTVYDRLAEQGAFTEPEPEPVDERSEVQKYLDSVLEEDGTLIFFGTLLSVGDVDKEEILAAIEASPIPYTASSLRHMYAEALAAAMEEGINVDNRFKALLVATHTVPEEISAATKNQLIVSANMAGRSSVNLTRYVVGQKHIRVETALFTRMELNDADVFRDGKVPVVVVFDENVDEELEEERRQAEEEAARVGETNAHNGYNGYDEDDGEEDEEDDYDF